MNHKNTSNKEVKKGKPDMRKDVTEVIDIDEVETIPKNVR